jgi:Mn2+/Fe2+ NRAMP family transporter
VGSAWIRRRPPLNRAAAGALATLLCSISAFAYGQTVWTSLGHPGNALMIAGVASCLVLPFVLLVILSRVGRAAEVRRDLNKKGDAS